MGREGQVVLGKNQIALDLISDLVYYIRSGYLLYFLLSAINNGGVGKQNAVFVYFLSVINIEHI